MTQQRTGSATPAAFMLVGALAGAAGALLLAPRTGQETRDKLKTAKDNWQDHALNATDKVSDKVRRGIQRASNMANERADQAIDVVDASQARTRKSIKDNATSVDEMEDLV